MTTSIMSQYSSHKPHRPKAPKDPMPQLPPPDDDPWPEDGDGDDNEMSRQQPKVPRDGSAFSHRH